MKIFLFITFLFFSFLMVSPNILAETVSGKVVYVYDGDTIKLEKENGEQIKIRLAQIDTPESSGQPWSSEAKSALRSKN